MGVQYLSTRRPAASLVAGMRGLQSDGRTLRGISLGQQVKPGFLALSSDTIVSSSSCPRSSP